MGAKMKGLYKGFKYTLAQIFVVKDRKMEIGSPTNVKHVSHIGWGGNSGAAPTWMNEFRTGPDVAPASIGHSASTLSPWSSQDFGESVHQRSESETMFKNMSVTDHSSVTKKQKRKKTKSTCSPNSTTSCSTRSTRVSKSIEIA